MASAPSTRRSQSTRLFGYDIFVSFALGPPPRGSRSYASDLARKLRELDFTVFFSEDEAPVGGELDSTLKRALRWSRVLVVVANRATLTDPRWVRAEVEEFRRLHPDRPVVPISIDGALQDPAVAEQVASWLRHRERIWVEESREAAESGEVSASVVARLATAPTALRSSVRWRGLVVATLAFFAALAALSSWMGLQASRSARAEAKAATEARAAEVKASDAAAREAEAARAARSAEHVASRAAASEARAASAARAAQQEAERQRDQAIARQLALESARLAGVAGQWDRATLLLVESMRRAPDASGYDALWQLTQTGARPLVRCADAKPVRNPVFDAGGTRLAMAGQDEVLVCDLATGTMVARLPLAGARQVAFDEGGRRLVAASDQAVKVFDLDSRRELSRLDGGRPPGANAFSADGRLMALAEPGRVSVFDVFAGTATASITTDMNVRQLALGAGGKRLALIDGGAAMLVDVDTGRSLPVPAQPGSVAGVEFTDDGRLATIRRNSATDGPAVFDLESGRQTRTLPPGTVTALDPRQGYAAVQRPGAANVSIGRLDGHLPSPEVPVGNGVSGHHRSQDGEWLALAGADGSVNVVRVGSGRLMARRVRASELGQGFELSGVALDGQGRRVAAAWNREVVVLAVRDDRPLTTLPPDVLPTRLVVAADGRHWAAIAASNREVLVGEAGQAPGERVPVCAGARSLSLDGAWRRLVVQCADGFAEVVERAGARRLGRWPHTSASPPALSADGRLLLATRGSAAVIDVDSGQTLRVIGGDSQSAAAFSPDRRFLALGSSTGVRLARLPAGVERQLDIDGGAASLAFSRAGTWLAVGTRKRFAQVFDVESGRLLASLDHKQEETQVLGIGRLVFDDSGRLLATAARDATQNLSRPGDTLRVFDLASGRERLRATIGEATFSLAFDRQGPHLEFATGWRAMGIERLPLDPAVLVGDACARVSRNLTRAEWSRYLGALPSRVTCPALNPAAAGG